jgi:hypothetical protein
MEDSIENSMSANEPGNENKSLLKYAYHVTRRCHVESIMEKGLEPNVPSDYGDFKGVYLFKTIEDTENALYNWLGDRIEEWEEENDEEYEEVVLKINTAGLEENLIDSVAYEWTCLVVIVKAKAFHCENNKWKKYMLCSLSLF